MSHLLKYHSVEPVIFLSWERSRRWDWNFMSGHILFLSMNSDHEWGSIVLCVMCCRSLFVFLYFWFCPLYGLSSYLRVLILPIVWSVLLFTSFDFAHCMVYPLIYVFWFCPLYGLSSYLRVLILPIVWSILLFTSFDFVHCVVYPLIYVIWFCPLYGLSSYLRLLIVPIVWSILLFTTSDYPFRCSGFHDLFLNYHITS